MQTHFLMLLKFLRYLPVKFRAVLKTASQTCFFFRGCWVPDYIIQRTMNYGYQLAIPIMPILRWIVKVKVSIVIFIPKTIRKNWREMVMKQELLTTYLVLIFINLL